MADNSRLASRRSRLPVPGFLVAIWGERLAVRCEILLRLRDHRAFAAIVLLGIQTERRKQRTHRISHRRTRVIAGLFRERHDVGERVAYHLGVPLSVGRYNASTAVRREALRRAIEREREFQTARDAASNRCRQSRWVHSPIPCRSLHRSRVSEPGSDVRHDGRPSWQWHWQSRFGLAQNLPGHQRGRTRPLTAAATATATT